MAKFIPDSYFDTYLQSVEGTRIHICTSQPANYAGIAAVELAAATITGSYTLADGDTSGRKNTLPAQSDIPIHTSGTAQHIAISNGSDTLYLVTTCTSQALTTSGTSPQTATVDTTAFDHEINDPT